MFSEDIALNFPFDLKLVATWDRDKKRPIMEEFIIKGLFGDIEPCQSQAYSIKDLEDLITNDSVRRNETEFKTKDQIIAFRRKEWRRFYNAHLYFISVITETC